VRLAVATGPGGFTSTRLTVVLARTLAQQLALPLDGVGSLVLMAQRLALACPTWLVQPLPRRGLVAGLYGPDPGRPGVMREWAAPRLHADEAALQALRPAPCQAVAEDVAADVLGLLERASAAQLQREPAPWQPVLPIYPTSPVALV
jgi:tRNA A37 threonylcarbamoyladenosine modification protein TsaB